MTDVTHLPRHPFGVSIQFADIVTRLEKATQWEDRYREIIRLSRQMPSLPESWRTEEYEIFGCENRVWLASDIDAAGNMHFVADSESRIVKGLLGILLTQCEGLSPQQLVGRDLLAGFSQLGLTPTLSATRQSGLAAVAHAVITAAERAVKSA